VKVIVADDSALLREGIAGLLERQGHEVVGQAASADELLAVVEHAGPVDVVITDVRMPPRMSDDGLRAALQIRARRPEVGILVVSQYIAPEFANQLFAPGPDGAAGAALDVSADVAPEGVGGLGYLLKDRISRVADFLRSLAVVAAGGVVIDPDVAARLMHRTPSRLAALTPREREVLELMARGLSNNQIGAELFLSDGAVSKHVANVFAKLDLGPGEDNRRVRAVLAFLSAGE